MARAFRILMYSLDLIQLARLRAKAACHLLVKPKNERQVILLSSTAPLPVEKPGRVACSFSKAVSDERHSIVVINNSLKKEPRRSASLAEAELSKALEAKKSLSNS